MAKCPVTLPLFKRPKIFSRLLHGKQSKINKCRISYPVHNLGPSLHGYALKHSYHGERDVIKSRYTTVRPWPELLAFISRFTLSSMKNLPNSWPGFSITRPRIVLHDICKRQIDIASAETENKIRTCDQEIFFPEERGKTMTRIEG